MSRRDEEPVKIAEYADRTTAEEAWTALLDNDIPATVLLTPAPLGGRESHRIEVARKDAAAALEVIVGFAEP